MRKAETMNFIGNLISEYGLYAMFLIILMEYACFPVSSEIILPLSGAVASAGNINFFVILPLSILAGLLGTGICFIAGWFGGGAILRVITRRFPKSRKAIEGAEERFRLYGSSAVCIGRVIPLIRTYIAIIAGTAKMNPVTYFSASALGIAVWNTLLIGLGFILRENYKAVADYYLRYKHNLLPVIILLSALFLLNLIYRKTKSKKHASRIESKKE